MSQLPLRAEDALVIFFQAIRDYHVNDDVNVPESNPYHPESQTLEYLLYKKNWIDTVQWHFEDIIRAPDIDPVEGIRLKRRIDSSNQQRNDTVEKIDEWLQQALAPIMAKKHSDARLNSESPAWVLDRLSIICLKIYHMEKEIARSDADEIHKTSCSQKLLVLREQSSDLSQCFNELLQDIMDGKKYMKVYRQMKMYNDPSMNPVLYKNAGRG